MRSIILVVFLSSLAVPSVAQVELLGPAPKSSNQRKAALDPRVRRERGVTFNSQSLQVLAAPGELGSHESPSAARFALFDDLAATVVFDRSYQDPHGEWAVWSGPIDGHVGSSVSIATSKGVTTGYFRFADGTGVELLGAPDGTAVVHELAPEGKVPTCAAQTDRSAEPVDLGALKELASIDEFPDRMQTTPDNGRMLDILALYTPQASLLAGGEVAIRTRILAANEAANRGLVDSDVDLEFRVVAFSAIDYFESSGMELDLTALQRAPFVAALRDQFAADVVHLIERSTGEYCGIARIASNESLRAGIGSFAGFAVTDLNCLTADNPTYQHEVGHTMGLYHDPVTRAEQGFAGSVNPPYAQGYQQRSRTPEFYTIMAYSCPGCEGINRWANPVDFHRGSPTGIEGLHDTAGYISLHKQFITNYRVSGRDEALPAVAEIITPPAGTVLQEGLTNFEWRPRPFGFYRLRIGTQGDGSSNVYRSARLGRPHLQVDLPNYRGTLHVELESWDGAIWHSRRYTYAAESSGPQGVEFTASPVTDCGSPQTTLRWKAPGAGPVQVRIGSASGKAMTGWEPDESTAISGPWVSAETIFVLVNRSGIELARVTPVYNCDGGPTEFTASSVTDCTAPITTVRWKAPAAGQVQVRVGSATGAAMTGWEPEEGIATSGPWVHADTTFVLVSRSGAELARVKPKYLCGGVGQIEFTASPVVNCSEPATTLRWRAPGKGQVQVRVDSTVGRAITGWESEEGTVTTGPWVTRPTTFYLVDRSARELARARAENVCPAAVTQVWYSRIPAAAARRIEELRGAGKNVRRLALGPNGSWVILFDWNGFEASGVRSDLIGRLRSFKEQGLRIRHVALSPIGLWVVLLDGNGWASYAPSDLNEALSELNRQNREIKSVEFAQNGGWIVVHGANEARWRGVPNDFASAYLRLYAQGAYVNSVTFGRDSWLIVFDGNGFWPRGIPQDLQARLESLNRAAVPISEASIGQTAEWFVLSVPPRVGRLVAAEEVPAVSKADAKQPHDEPYFEATLPAENEHDDVAIESREPR